MNCLVKKEELIRVLKLATAVATKRSTMPILANVRLVARDGRMEVSATNLTTSMSALIPAAIAADGEGEITTDASNLLAMASASAGDVHLRTDKSSWVEVRSGKSVWRALGLPTKDFPRLDDPTTVQMVEVPAGAVRDLIDRTLFAASTQEAQPHLQGILFEGDGQVMKTVTCDGHRLALASATLPLPFEVRALVPTDGCRQMLGVLEGVEKAEIGYERGRYLFLRLPNLWYGHKLLDDHSFPPYAAVVPTSFAHAASCELPQLEAAIKRVMLATLKDSAVASYELGEGALKLAAESPLGRAEDEIDLELLAGSGMRFACNPVYLLQAIQHAPVGRVRLSVNTPKDPVQISAEGRDDFLTIIMPILA